MGSSAGWTETREHSPSSRQRGQQSRSHTDGGRGLIQTLPALEERQKHPSRLEAEQIETLIAGKFYEDNKKHHNKWP